MDNEQIRQEIDSLNKKFKPIHDEHYKQIRQIQKICRHTDIIKYPIGFKCKICDYVY